MRRPWEVYRYTIVMKLMKVIYVLTRFSGMLSANCFEMCPFLFPRTHSQDDSINLCVTV